MASRGFACLVAAIAASGLAGLAGSLAVLAGHAATAGHFLILGLKKIICGGGKRGGPCDPCGRSGGKSYALYASPSLAGA